MNNPSSQEFNLDYQALLNNITDGLMCLNEKYEVLMVNQSFEKLTGLSADSLKGKNLIELYPHLKEYPGYETFIKIFITKEPFKTTTYLPKIQKWIQVSAYYQTGNVVLVLKDETEPKLHEIAIQSYVDKIKAVMESMHTSFALIGKEYEVLMFNKTLSDNLFKYTGKHIKTGDNAIEWTHPKYRDIFKSDIDRALSGEKVFKEVVYNISDEQLPTWYYEAFYPVYNQQSEILGVAFHTQNINKLKLNEIKATHFNQLYENILKATNEAIWEWNLKTNALKWNDNFSRIFGYNNEPITYTATAWEECIHPDDRKDTMDKVAKAIASKSSIAESSYRFLSKNGQYKYVIDRGYITYDENGTPDMMVGAMQDIQKIKEHEEQILQQNRNLSQIAHSQSHEVRGPVSTILGLINLLNKQQKELNPEVNEILEHLNKTTLRLDIIVKDSIHEIENMKNS